VKYGNGHVRLSLISPGSNIESHYRGFECCLAIAAGFSTLLSDFATSATKWYQPVTFFVGPNVSASTTGSTTGEPPEGL